jgi:hypothetical protein
MLDPCLNGLSYLASPYDYAMQATAFLPLPITNVSNCPGEDLRPNDGVESGTRLFESALCELVLPVLLLHLIDDMGQQKMWRTSAISRKATAYRLGALLVSFDKETPVTIWQSK